MSVDAMWRPPAAHYGPIAPAFRSLGWRSVAASICIGAFCAFDALLGLVQLAFGDLEADPDLGKSLIVLMVALAQLGTLLLSMIFFGTWMHGAASNLRALGRQGLQFSPGWSVGWFFVPFANLVKVPQVMLEIWRGSNPASPSFGWQSSPATPAIPLWWGAWIAANVIGRVSSSIHDAEASAQVGLLSSFFVIVAGVIVIGLMRSISARQLEASRLPTPAY